MKKKKIFTSFFRAIFQNKWFLPQKTTNIYLPDDCWEHIFRILNGNNHHYYLNTLSVVSKQFLSITNRMRMRFSLTVYNPAVPFLPRLLHRFTNLTLLHLFFYDHRYGELHAALCQICQFPLKLTSLNISGQHFFPTSGLRAFSQNITALTSLTCSDVIFIDDADLSFIANCFPLLEVLNLSNTPTSKNYFGIFEDGIGQILMRCRNKRHLNLAYCPRLKLRGMNSVVSKLEVLNLSHTEVDDETFYVISNCCRGLLQLLLSFCCDVTEKGVKHLLDNCIELREISLRCCYNVHPDVVASMISSRSSLRKIRHRFSNKENYWEKPKSHIG